MKSTGITRRVDELGRIVLPKELRNTFKINQADAMEIYVDDDKIILVKKQPSCVFCGSGENLKEFKRQLICSNCIKELA
jgi:transcriptional pleiotropic regulator of transition state genes